jgi:catechol 2,3-dioxygenase-like lactoylglutathione lyase family enzyme
MIDALHHLVITVAQIERTELFYSIVLKPLGWTVRGRANDFVEFVPPNDPQGKSFLLVFGLARDLPSPLAPFNRNQVGLDHFAFQAPNEQTLQAVLHSLQAAGIEVETGAITDDDFGGRALFCVDPDGMKVEVHLHQG